MNAAFLTAALRGDRLRAQRLASVMNPSALRSWAQAHKIEAVVAFTLQWPEAPSNTTRVQGLIEDAAEVMASVPHPHVAIEAGAVMLCTSLPVEAYGSTDIDFMVSETHKPIFERALKDHGFNKTHRASRVQATRSEWTKGSSVIELGSEVYYRHRSKLPTKNPLRGFLKNRVPSSKNPQLYVPCPSDLLVQVCVHTSLHHYLHSPGPRLHLDVHHLLSAHPDVGSFLEKARNTQLTTRIWLSLLCAQRFVGTVIPAHWLDELAPPQAWRRKALKQLVFEKGPLHPLSKRRLLLLDLLQDDRGPSRWLATTTRSMLRSRT